MSIWTIESLESALASAAWFPAIRWRRAGVAIAWLVMSRRFKNLTDRYDAITVPDYLEARFRDASHAIRLVSAGTLVVSVGADRSIALYLAIRKILKKEQWEGYTIQAARPRSAP